DESHARLWIGQRQEQIAALALHFTESIAAKKPKSRRRRGGLDGAGDRRELRDRHRRGAAVVQRDTRADERLIRRQPDFLFRAVGRREFDRLRFAEMVFVSRKSAFRLVV